jgi:hypothetical protein
MDKTYGVGCYDFFTPSGFAVHARAEHPSVIHLIGAICGSCPVSNLR